MNCCSLYHSNLYSNSCQSSLIFLLFLLDFAFVDSFRVDEKCWWQEWWQWQRRIVCISFLMPTMMWSSQGLFFVLPETIKHIRFECEFFSFQRVSSDEKSIFQDYAIDFLSKSRPSWIANFNNWRPFSSHTILHTNYVKWYAGCWMSWRFSFSHMIIDSWWKKYKKLYTKVMDNSTTCHQLFTYFVL